MKKINYKNKFFIRALKDNKNNLSFYSKIKIHYKNIKLNSLIKVKNNCFLTKRYRGCIHFFGLSRHSIKELSVDNLIPGLQKSSW